MWLEEILNEKEYQLLLSKYTKEYIMLLDKDNFLVIYDILDRNGFYFINDMIIKYLDIFFMKPNDVLEKIMLIKIEYGEDFIDKISKNMNLLDLFLEQ